jgi:hypothetical protein
MERIWIWLQINNLDLEIQQQLFYGSTHVNILLILKLSNTMKRSTRLILIILVVLTLFATALISAYYLGEVIAEDEYNDFEYWPPTKQFITSETWGVLVIGGVLIILAIAAEIIIVTVRAIERLIEHNDGRIRRFVERNRLDESPDIITQTQVLHHLAEPTNGPYHVI